MQVLNYTYKFAGNQNEFKFRHFDNTDPSPS